ncbi:hypothetical protein ACH5A3_42615 [Streptomyces echinatus]|uniref:hypothetical protein n=1 Tax=Streptomyces echinatus TaxID=67293 RepID=UPI00379400C9
MWSIADNAQRAQWTFVPFETVGPLRFGMSIEEVATTMGAQGFTSTHSSMTRPHGALVQRAGFRSKKFGLLVRAQRAGDVLLSRIFFVGNFQDWACTVHDCVPVDEWDIR